MARIDGAFSERVSGRCVEDRRPQMGGQAVKLLLSGRMPNPQLDQFMQDLTSKAVAAIVLGSIGAFLLREFLRWLERKATRLGQSLRTKRGTRTPRTKLDSASDFSPHCPSCNTLMVKRTARRGANAGSNFWGCSEYPRCRATRAI